jgi:hypothetical protein
MVLCWEDASISVGCSTSSLNVYVLAFLLMCFLNISCNATFGCAAIQLTSEFPTSHVERPRRRLPRPAGSARAADRGRQTQTSNENDDRTLTVMPSKPPQSDSTGPMGIQPVERGPTAPTQMLPMMPGTQTAAKPPAPEKKQGTRADAMRAALARIARRNSLRKQRDALKS